MIWLQISASTGPAECCLAVAKALACFCGEARRAGVAVRLVEQLAGPVTGTFRSVLLELDGPGGAALALRWSGSLLWICDSPYRPAHRRKNWFIGGAVVTPATPAVADGAIHYQATRASGPGGQHVNKTDSAIRATHVATGLSVKVDAGRSQHANKRLAGQLLSVKLAQLDQAGKDKLKTARHLQHSLAQRGDAARVFVGPAFVERTEEMR